MDRSSHFLHALRFFNENMGSDECEVSSVGFPVVDSNFLFDSF